MNESNQLNAPAALISWNKEESTHSQRAWAGQATESTRWKMKSWLW